jgi:hypothetical protein
MTTYGSWTKVCDSYLKAFNDFASEVKNIASCLCSLFIIANQLHARSKALTDLLFTFSPSVTAVMTCNNDADLSLEGFDYKGFITAHTLSFQGGPPVISQPVMWTPATDNPSKF